MIIFLITSFEAASSALELPYELENAKDGLIVRVHQHRFTERETKEDFYEIYRIRRNNSGDRLSEAREFWKEGTKKEVLAYEQICQDVIQVLKREKVLEFILKSEYRNEFEELLHLKKMACLSEFKGHEIFLGELLRDKIKLSQLRFPFDKYYKKYRRKWFDNVIGKNADLYSLLYQSIEKLFYKNESKQQAYIEKLLKENRLTPLSLETYSDKVYSEHGLVITHATANFDRAHVIKEKMDQLINDFKAKKAPILFLVPDNGDLLWFSDNRRPTQSFYSKWGEHNYSFQNEVTLIGGQWKNCLRVTIVDLITRHFNKFSQEFTINLPLKGIYNEYGELLKGDFQKVLEEKKLEAFIERGTIFGGYRILIDDPHYGEEEVDSDMNLFTGIPLISEYSYRVFRNDLLILDRAIDGTKVVNFTFVD